MEMTTQEIAALPLEELVGLELGQKMIGELIAAEGLQSEVENQIALLDVPVYIKTTINQVRDKKIVEMNKKDPDASQLLCETDPVTLRFTSSALASRDNTGKRNEVKHEIQDANYERNSTIG